MRTPESMKALTGKAAILAASIAATAMAGGLGMDDWAKMPATRHVFSMSCKVTACNGDRVVEGTRLHEAVA